MASSEGDPPTNILDHIVYLAAPEKLQDTIEEWRKQGYTVIPGGTHADGLTENALVALKDGIYIELISFVHSIEHYPPGSPSRLARENHTWAKKLPNGYIDYAFLGNNGWPSIAESINRRAEESQERSAGREVRYEKESKGGRTRLDGVKLEWVISARKAFGEGKEDVIGSLPFFCGDVTPRELRVPHEPDQVTHSNQITGISEVHLLVSSDGFERYEEQLSVVLGYPPAKENSSNTKQAIWELQTPPTSSSEEQISHSSSRAGEGSGNAKPRLVLRTPEGEKEERWLSDRGAGIYEIVTSKDKEDH